MHLAFKNSPNSTWAHDSWLWWLSRAVNRAEWLFSVINNSWRSHTVDNTRSGTKHVNNGVWQTVKQTELDQITTLYSTVHRPDALLMPDRQCINNKHAKPSNEVPGMPNAEQKLPCLSKICMRWLSVSATTTSSFMPRQKPCGELNWPRPLPGSPILHLDTMWVHITPTVVPSAREIDQLKCFILCSYAVCLSAASNPQNTAISNNRHDSFLYCQYNSTLWLFKSGWVLAWESKCKGTNAPSLRSPVLDKKGQGQDTDWLAFWVSFWALTLPVPLQKGHPGHKQPEMLNLKSKHMHAENRGQPAKPDSPGKQPLKRRHCQYNNDHDQPFHYQFIPVPHS